jgi:hypothetical protein
VLRTDVVADNLIQVDQTIHWFSAAGSPLGMARFPQYESYYYVHSSLAVGPEGYVYALIPRPEQVDVVRLLFYQQLPPLIPSAVSPSVQVDVVP